MCRRFDAAPGGSWLLRILMMNLRQIIVTAAALGLGITSTSAAKPKSAKTFAADEFANLHRLIGPRVNEANWEKVPWMPSNDLWAARKKAAEEERPLLLWYMAGEPLGTC